MARLIVEVFGRAWLLEFHSAKLPEDEECEEDSHVTVGGSFERASDDDDADDDEAGQRKFGFS